jgi:hypothetical protein
MFRMPTKVLLPTTPEKVVSAPPWVLSPQNQERAHHRLGARRSVARNQIASDNFRFFSAHSTGQSGHCLGAVTAFVRTGTVDPRQG